MWGNTFFDSTCGFPGEGPLNIVSMNVTAWSSFEVCLNINSLNQFDIICIQEHRIDDDGRIEAANRTVDRHGFRGCFQKCVVTEANGKSAGVAILWKKHISVCQVSHLYHDARTVSVQIEVPVVGRMNLVCTYGWDSQVTLNLNRIRELCQDLHAQGVPFAILGDHNMEPHECGPMLEGLSSKVVIKHAGVSCVTHAKLSILDYAIVSYMWPKLILR